MTEEQQVNDEISAEEKHEGSEVFAQLNTLGQELASAFRALWEHEDSRKVRREIQAGFMELGRQVDVAVKTAQESDATKQFTEQVKETVDKARESDVAAKVEEGLVTGLRELNVQISNWVHSLEKAEAGEVPEEAEAETESEA